MIHRRAKLAIYLAAFVAVCDQISKWWLLNNIHPTPGTPIEETSFFNLVLVHNRGVTFGLMNNIDHRYASYILAAVAVVILLLLGRWLLRTSSGTVSFGLGLVMGGAIGNVIDRLRYGAVIDFLDFYYQNMHWPAFNLADAAIVTGVGLLLLDSLVRAR